MEIPQPNRSCLQKYDSECKFAIFDLDGTLIDSFECVLRCVNKSLESFSLPHVRIASPLKSGDIEIIFRLAKESIDGILPFSEFKKRFDETHLGDCTESISVVECVYAKLIKHCQEGVKIIILTNKYHPIAEKICEQFMDRSIITVIGRKDSDLSKTKEFYLNAFMNDNVIHNSQFICYYGDTHVDNELATKHSIPFIKVSSPGTDFPEGGVSHTIGTTDCKRP